MPSVEDSLPLLSLKLRALSLIPSFQFPQGSPAVCPAWGRAQPCGAEVGPGPVGACWPTYSYPCRAVGLMMSTVCYPLITFVLLSICIAYWAMTALYPLPTEPALLGPVGAEGREGSSCTVP